jgi:hypothetical protein
MRTGMQSRGKVFGRVAPRELLLLQETRDAIPLQVRIT